MNYQTCKRSVLGATTPRQDSEAIVCELVCYCGNTITFKNTDSHKVRDTKVYCSPKCHNQTRRKPPQTKPTKVCDCGTTFVIKQNKKYCSKQCQYRYGQCIPTVTVQCAGCGIDFIRGGGVNRKKLYCSIDCHRRTVRATKKAHKRSVTVETFNPIAVLERDGWQCYLCGVSTPRELRGTYNDNAPELEHIIALANGGAHSVANTACACRKCNGLKAANDNFIPNSLAA